jgi:hypothetical protein
VPLDIANEYVEASKAHPLHSGTSFPQISSSAAVQELHTLSARHRERRYQISQE